MAIDLDKKIGPLKLKTWGLVGAGTFGLVWYATRRGDLPADAEDVSNVEDVGSLFPADSGGYFPSTGGGGGGYEGMDASYTQDLAPIEDAIIGLGSQLEDIQGQLGTIEEQTAPEEEVPPPTEMPGGGVNPFAERIKRLLARRRKLRAAARSADSGRERRRIQARVRKTSKRIRRVRAKKRAARRK